MICLRSTVQSKPHRPAAHLHVLVQVMQASDIRSPIAHHQIRGLAMEVRNHLVSGAAEKNEGGDSWGRWS